MRVEGKVFKVEDIQTGISNSGREWRRQSVIIAYRNGSDMWPRKLPIELFGDDIERYNLEKGDDVMVEFYIDAQSYNDRWYTRIYLDGDRIIKKPKKHPFVEPTAPAADANGGGVDNATNGTEQPPRPNTVEAAMQQKPEDYDPLPY